MSNFITSVVKGIKLVLGKTDKEKPKSDPTGFISNPKAKIKAGQKILHSKFGKGLVKSIDDRYVATISFDAFPKGPDKRIMLEYAQLQILEE